MTEAVQEAVDICKRGTIHWIKGNFDRAIALFDEAISLDPNFAPIAIGARSCRCKASTKRPWPI